MLPDQDGVRTSVLQGGVHRVQERPEEPAREHRLAAGGGLLSEGGRQVSQSSEGDGRWQWSAQ